MEQISRQNCPWFSEERVSLLQSHQIRTFIDFITKDQNFVLNAGGFTVAEYEFAKMTITESIRPAPITARQLVEKAQEPLFPTGVQKLDGILGGGLGGGELLEIYGKFGTGKTQLCLAIAAQFCHFEKEKFSVVYFDLKNDFRATRFLSFCQGVENSLDNILIIRPSSFPELITFIEDLNKDISNLQSNFYAKVKLVIFDSVPMAVYPTTEEDPVSWRFHEELLMEKTFQLAQLNNGIVVILVNHSVVTGRNFSAPGPGEIIPQQQSGPPSKPAMGKYWLHKPNFRLYVSEYTKKSDSSGPAVYNAVLEKSSRTESVKAFEFSITKDGIES